MKKIYVLRHAPKDANGKLTEEGKVQATLLKNKLQPFDMVIASNMPRAQETAVLLTGRQPTIDKRASIIDINEEQERELFEAGKQHPQGIAGVVFDTPEYRELVKIRGNTLVALIKETLEKLSENQTALIVTHDAPMVAAEKIMKNLPLEKAEKFYKPLKGFIVYADLSTEEIA